MNQESWVKINVFVPRTHLKVVLDAIGETEVNKIGDYDYCAYVSEGEGYFRPLEGAHPSRGKIGDITSVKECKIEFIAPRKEIARVREAIVTVHPYEEVVLDIMPLLVDK